MKSPVFCHNCQKIDVLAKIAKWGSFFGQNVRKSHFNQSKCLSKLWKSHIFCQNSQRSRLLKILKRVLYLSQLSEKSPTLCQKVLISFRTLLKMWPFAKIVKRSSFFAEIGNPNNCLQKFWTFFFFFFIVKISKKYCFWPQMPESHFLLSCQYIFPVCFFSKTSKSPVFCLFCLNGHFFIKMPESFIFAEILEARFFAKTSKRYLLLCQLSKSPVIVAKFSIICFFFFEFFFVKCQKTPFLPNL